MSLLSFLGFLDKKESGPEFFWVNSLGQSFDCDLLTTLGFVFAIFVCKTPFGFFEVPDFRGLDARGAGNSGLFSGWWEGCSFAFWFRFDTILLCLMVLDVAGVFGVEVGKCLPTYSCGNLVQGLLSVLYFVR